MKKWTLLIIIQKNDQQPKKISIYLLVIHCLHNVHLIQKNKLDYYRDTDDMKRFCKDLKECAAEIINYEKKEMIPQTYETNKKIRK